MSDPFSDFINGAVSDVLEARWYPQPKADHWCEPCQDYPLFCDHTEEERREPQQG